jgi:hypothetical protein
MGERLMAFEWLAGILSYFSHFTQYGQDANPWRLRLLASGGLTNDPPQRDERLSPRLHQRADIARQKAGGLEGLA